MNFHTATGIKQLMSPNKRKDKKKNNPYAEIQYNRRFGNSIREDIPIILGNIPEIYLQSSFQLTT